MISVIFFVLICSKETKTEMNTKKVAHDSPHCTLIFCTHNFFYTIASFVPKGYSGFQETWMIILFSSSQLKKYLPNFPTPKESWNQKFQTQQILQSSPSLKIQSTSTGVSLIPPQISLSKVLLMTYFITAKQIVDYEAESEISTSKKETTTNGKRTKYPVFFETEIHSTGKRNTLNSGERACNKLQWGGVFGIKRLPRGGESMVGF